MKTHPLPDPIRLTAKSKISSTPAVGLRSSSENPAEGWIFPIFDQNCPIEDGFLRKGFPACGEDDINLADQKGKNMGNGWGLRGRLASVALIFDRWEVG